MLQLGSAVYWWLLSNPLHFSNISNLMKGSTSEFLDAAYVATLYPCPRLHVTLGMQAELVVIVVTVDVGVWVCWHCRGGEADPGAADIGALQELAARAGEGCSLAPSSLLTCQGIQIASETGKEGVEGTHPLFLSHCFVLPASSLLGFVGWPLSCLTASSSRLPSSTANLGLYGAPYSTSPPYWAVKAQTARSPGP